jgi:hypothetical protein
VKLKGYLLLLTVLLPGCETSRVISEFDPSVDFTSYQTFSVCLDDFEVLSPDHAGYRSEKMKGYFKDAIETELKKHYRIGDPLADLKVGLAISIQDKKLMYRSCDQAGDYDRWPECRIRSYEYTEGSILVFVADRKTNQLIWQASQSGIVNDDLARNRKVIERVIQTLFKEFPGSYKPELKVKLSNDLISN